MACLCGIKILYLFATWIYIRDYLGHMGLLRFPYGTYPSLSIKCDVRPTVSISRHYVQLNVIGVYGNFNLLHFKVYYL